MFWKTETRGIPTCRLCKSWLTPRQYSVEEWQSLDGTLKQLTALPYPALQVLGCRGELFPPETRDSWMPGLVLCRLYFYFSFLPPLVSLGFIISRQSSISLPSVTVKLVFHFGGWLVSAALRDVCVRWCEPGLSLQQWSRSCKVRGIWDLF